MTAHADKKSEQHMYTSALKAIAALLVAVLCVTVLWSTAAYVPLLHTILVDAVSVACIVFIIFMVVWIMFSSSNSPTEHVPQVFAVAMLLGLSVQIVRFWPSISADFPL